MSLLEPRLAYKPFEYPWAYQAWKRQQQIHWLPDEVPLHEDVQDWNTKLTPAEKNLLTQIFRFFTQADVDVNDCYMTKYASVFRPPEVRMMLSAFSSMETVHIDAYSHLMSTIGMPDGEYSAFLNIPAMKAKHNYGATFSTITPLETARTLAGFGAFTEGLQLFASFAILLNFPRQNKMKGMGQIITWSVRDETLHCASLIKLYHQLVSEQWTVPPATLRARIMDDCYNVISHEDAFIDAAFSLGPVDGLTPDEVKLYIRWIANRRLDQLNIPGTRFEVDKNPLPWMDAILNNVEHANFFETRATEYSKAATKGNWGDVEFGRPERIDIFTKKGCPFCDDAKALLSRMGLGYYVEHDLSWDKERQDFYKKTGLKSVPAIYFDGSLIGGYDALSLRLGLGVFV